MFNNMLDMRTGGLEPAVRWARDRSITCKFIYGLLLQFKQGMWLMECFADNRSRQ